MFDWLIVGAGFAGSVLAERLANQLGDMVLLIDRRSHIAGNAYDRFDDTGKLVPSYGRHVLRTDDIRVLDYLSQFTKWRRVPVDSGSTDVLLPPRFRIGDARSDVFSLASVMEDEIEAASAKDEEETGEDLCGQALIPAEGYTKMFERMLLSPNIKIMLNTDFAEVRDIIPFRRLVYTGSIDEYFDYCYGRLPYQAAEADERGYPVGGMEGDDLLRRYEELAEASMGVFFIGRLAEYKFCSMSEVVAQALARFERIAAPADPQRHAGDWSTRPGSSLQ